MFAKEIIVKVQLAAPCLLNSVAAV
jgi:hypothetical protein